MCGTTEIPTEKRKRAAQLSSLRPVNKNMSGYLGSGHPWRFPRFSLGAGRDASQNVAAVECSRPDRRGRAPAVGAVSPGVRTLVERFDIEAYSDFSAK